jgi:hypothetical protein
MGQNKAQKQAAERTKKTTSEVQPAAVGPNPGQINGDTGKVNEQPKPPATPAPAAPSKQDATLAKLKEGWTAKGVNLSKLTVKDEGKFKNVIVAEGWPTVRIGASGGLAVLELKSYPDAFTAAMEGLERYTKQQARETKKATAPAAPAVKAEEKKKPEVAVA